jgi:hypothetical protein
LSENKVKAFNDLGCKCQAYVSMLKAHYAHTSIHFDSLIFRYVFYNISMNLEQFRYSTSTESSVECEVMCCKDSKM